MIFISSAKHSQIYFFLQMNYCSILILGFATFHILYLIRSIQKLVNDKLNDKYILKTNQNQVSTVRRCIPRELVRHWVRRCVARRLRVERQGVQGVVHDSSLHSCSYWSQRPTVSSKLRCYGATGLHNIGNIPGKVLLFTLRIFCRENNSEKYLGCKFQCLILVLYDFVFYKRLRF